MIIKNIRIIDPASGMDEIGNIIIEDGRIKDIATSVDTSVKHGDSIGGVEVIDGTGLVAAPGLLDAHVHFRDPGFEYKEDIYTGAAAAAKGGFTSVVMMANTKPAIDNPETLKYVLDKGAQTDINVYACGDVTVGLKGEILTDMEALKDLGAVGFTDDGIPLRNPEIVRAAMQEAVRLGVPLSFHEEDPAYISENGINADVAAPHFGIKGSPRDAEISMIRRDLEIAADYPVDIVIQHISSAEGVELVREARKSNPHVHAELTPHHFTLTEDAVIKHGTLAKMNPPLRTEADRQALIRGLQDGTIDLIATDHAPHSEEEKNKPLTQAPSGIIGLETSLGLGIRELVRPEILSLSELIEKMTINIARLYDIDAGRIYVGGPADLVIFDASEPWVVSGDYASKSSNSPFTGETLYGRIHMTICGGRVVYQAD